MRINNPHLQMVLNMIRLFTSTIVLQPGKMESFHVKKQKRYVRPLRPETRWEEDSFLPCLVSHFKQPLEFKYYKRWAKNSFSSPPDRFLTSPEDHSRGQSPLEEEMILLLEKEVLVTEEKTNHSFWVILNLRSKPLL